MYVPAHGLVALWMRAGRLRWTVLVPLYLRIWAIMDSQVPSPARVEACWGPGADDRVRLVMPR